MKNLHKQARLITSAKQRGRLERFHEPLFEAAAKPLIRRAAAFWRRASICPASASGKLNLGGREEGARREKRKE